MHVYDAYIGFKSIGMPKDATCEYVSFGIFCLWSFEPTSLHSDTPPYVMASGSMQCRP